MNTISPEQLDQLVKSGQSVSLIDVRTPVEFRASHLGFAQNIPLDQLDEMAEKTLGKAGHRNPVYVICQSGSRGQKACEWLRTRGYVNVVHVEGGMGAWEHAGLAVVRGKKAISLERQVRIAAGSLVAIGSALAYFVHPYFIALPAVIGAGLVFAGITDTCGMGMLLAKMPWNRIASPTSSTSTPPANCPAKNNSSVCG